MTTQKNPRVSISKVLLTYPKCPESKETLFEFLKTIPGFDCCLIGQEHHEDGDLHLHAFVKLIKARQMRHDAAMSMFKFGEYNADIEFLKTRADITRACRYCIKEDKNPLVHGLEIKAILSTKHERRYNTKEILEGDLNELIENGAINPASMRNIIWARQYWKLYNKPNDATDVRGIWLEGPAGCGKSTWAKDFGNAMGGFYEKAQNKWFDGYNGEPVIILEDLDTGTLNHYLKIWTDKWACKGEVKGGTVWLNHKYFVVTANYSIPDIAQKDSRSPEPDYALIDALTRRFRIMSLPPERQFFSFPEDLPTDVSLPEEPTDVSPPDAKLPPQ